MLKMLIVEDEKVIRETIYRLIDWESLGVKIIGLCRNGLEAYDMIVDEFPDIVMTDIKMPGLSGLELIEKIYKTDNKVQFIILSGYGEYEYTKVAMKYGIKHYLLKPCNAQEIIDVIEQVKKECHKKNMQKDIQKQNVRLSLALQDSATKALIIEQVGTNKKLEDIIKQYEPYIDFENTSYETCIFHMIEQEHIKSIIEKFNEYHNKRTNYIHTFNLYADRTLYITFNSYDFNFSEMDKIMENIYENRFKYKRHSFKNLYALIALFSRKISSFSEIAIIEGYEKVDIKVAKELSVVDTFVKNINRCSEADFGKYIEQFLEYIDRINNVNELHEVVSAALLRLPKNVRRRTLDVSIVAFLCEFRVISDIKKAKEVAKNQINKLKYPRKRQMNADEVFTHKIVEYVQEHIDDANLSLKYLAENYLYMNADYVSKKFVKCQGCRFSVFLANTRINKAKQLLIENKLSIAEIAAAVGCKNNPEYFSKLFKKHTGMPPSAYENSLK